MKIRNILTLTSALTLTAIFSTASNAEDFCTADHLNNAPAVKVFGCTLGTHQAILDKDKNPVKCHLEYNCNIKVSFGDKTLLQGVKTLAATFPNDKNLNRITIKFGAVNLNIQSVLEMPGPGK